VVTFCPAKFDRDISTLNISGFAEPLTESSYTAGERSGRLGTEISDHRHRRLLRPRRGGPSRRAAEQSDKFAPSHVSYEAEELAP
jgi:hypothetical protein